MDETLQAALAKFHDNGHSLLSPSGWDGWSRCLGMLVGLDQARKVATDNLASIEGTTAHTLLEMSALTWTSPLLVGGLLDSLKSDVQVWRDRIVGNPNNTCEIKQYAIQCHNDIINGTYPDDMRQEVEKCYQRIKAYRDDGWTVIAESRVSLEGFLGHTHCDGTSDIIMYKGDRLIVADLKYGKGIEVSPTHSGQLSLYAGGAVQMVFEQTGQIFDRIDLVIMQPRIGNGVWKVWETTFKDLYSFLQEAKTKSTTALKVLAGIADVAIKFDPNEKSCMWCHRKSDCEARMDHAMKSVQDAFAVAGVAQDSNMINHEISNQTISEVLDRAPFIVSFLKDIEEEAQKRASKGETIPGRKMVKGRAKRQWRDVDDIKQLFLACGISPMDFIDAKVKSPAQMDKVKLNDDQKSIVKKATEFTYGKNVLVLNSDKRSSVEQDVQQAFLNAGVVKQSS